MRLFLNSLLLVLIAIDVTLNDLNIFRIPKLPYLIVALIGLNFFFLKSKEIKHKVTLYFVLLTLLMFFVVMFNSGITSLQGISAISFNIPIILKYWLYFFLGLNFRHLNRNYFLIGTLIILYGFYNILTGDYLRIDYLKLHDSEDRTVIASASDILSLFVILYGMKIKEIKNVKLFENVVLVLTFIMTMYLIFIGGSRTSFALLFFSVVLYYGVSLKLVIAGLMFFYLIFGAVSEYVLSFDFLEEYRFISLFNLSEDNSANARTILLESGLVDIFENPVFGKFGGQLSSSISDAWGWRWGAYVHNFLSYYRQFGVLGFILFTLIFLKSSYGLYKISDKYIVLLMFLSFSVVVSRSYAFGYIFMIVGIYITEFNLNKNGI